MSVIKWMGILVFTIICFFQMNGQINVDFSGSSLTGCGAVQCSFVDLSTSSQGQIVSWQWDLGGIVSTNQSAARIFGTAGSYDVCLTVTDNVGNSATLCKPNYITVHALPQPDFMVTDPLGCIPFTTTFIDQSTSPNSTITNWIWGVGGQTGVFNGQGPITNTYQLPDVYSISLTVTDANGCTNSTTKSDYIRTYDKPYLSFTANDTSNCTAPFVVQFTNDSLQSFVSYSWNFGNGVVTNVANPPPVVYNLQGVYDIRLIGINNFTGCADTLFKNDYIHVGYNTNITSSVTQGCEDLTVNFMDASTEVADSVRWNFGDGTFSTEFNPTHIFTDPGCFQVSITRYLGDCVVSKNLNNCILVKPLPVVDFTISNPNGCTLPHTTSFNGIASNIALWQWNFGGLGSSSFQNPTFQFNEFGLFPVTLSVIGVNGCSATSDTMYVNNVDLQADIDIDHYQGCAPLVITLQENSLTSTPITSWEWQLDGVISTSQMPTFTLSDTGNFNLRLIVTNTLGCIDTTNFYDLASVGQRANLGFLGISQETCAYDPVTFQNNSDQYIDEYLWDFGDETTSTDFQPMHTYQDTGYFDIQLIATHNGCITQTDSTNYIYVKAPIAKFTINYNCAAPYIVSFTDSSVGADSLFWDFGDLTSDTDTSINNLLPTYVYPDTGKYTITLTAFNFETNCNFITTQEVYVTDPKANFVITNTEGCVPLNISVIDNSIFADKYKWIADGAEISNDSIAEPSFLYNNTGLYAGIQLVITDVNTCNDTLNLTDNIYVDDVTASHMITPLNGCKPLNMHFVSTSTSVFGNVTEQFWNVGNGLHLTSLDDFYFTLFDVGAYPISLMVRNARGCIDSILVTSNVSFPIAEFTSDTVGCAGSLINFQNSSTGSNLSYVWDFGDATFDNAQHPQHVYSSEGNFDIKLVVIDEFTCSDTIQKVQQIEIINPIANFHSDTNFADCPPLMVHFTNESQNSLEYKWDFGDMSGVSNLENPDHIYTYPGNYDVSLIAINDVCSDTLFFDDYININGPRGGFNYIVDTTCLPVKVTFIGQSNGIYRFNWDFGNNEIISSTTLKDRDTLIYYYTSAGIFLPKLILIDENIVGCVSVIQATKPINIPTFAIDFQSPIQQRCGLGHPINFINLSSSNQNFNFIEWNFEGGTPTISTEFEPIIVYNQEGIFDVTLIISNSFCKDTLIKENYIRIEDNPIAQFTLNNNIGCQPFNAITSNQSTSTLGTINQTIWTINNDSLYDYNISHLFVDTGMFDIKLTVVTAAGCIDSSSHSVQILPLANYDLLFTGEDTICIGGTTQLLATISSDTTGLTYYWTGEGLSCTSCLDPVVTPLSTNTYYFNVTNLVGCTSSLPLTVEVRNIALPEVSISPDQNICQGESIQLNVSGGDNVFSYQWDTTQIGLNCYNYCFNPIAHPDTSTTYYVAVTNQVYCTSIDSVTINVIEPPIDLPTPNEIICLGDSVQLNIAYGTNPHWLNPSHLSCSFCPDPIANPVISTTYLVSVDFQNCQFIDTFSVQIFDKNSISAGIDTTICLGSTTTLSAVGEGIISWSPTDLVSDPTILNPVVEPLSTTEFILEVTNGDCIVYDSILVNVIEKSDISALDTVICLGETVPLNVVGNFDKLEWTDLNIIQNNHYDFPSVSPDSSSVYEVIGTFSTCLPDTAQAMVFVENPPTIMIQDRYSFFYENTFTLTPEVVSNNPVSYEWISDFPLTCNDCPSTSIFVDSSTMVIVKVRDEITGCVNTDSIYFREITSCSDELIFVPNAFSPNDDTQNDVFKIYSSTIDEIKFLKIFDRWGNLIFETHDINIGWDGKFNGKSLPQGVYVVIIDAVCVLDAKPIHIKTDVTLLK